MFRQSWIIAASLITVIGLATLAPAQTQTAYSEHGKWVGYVPPHLRHTQPAPSRVFRSSIPDVSSCLASGSAKGAVTAAVAVEPAEAFEGALLDSGTTPKAQGVLPTGFDEPTLALDEPTPAFDESTGVMLEPWAEDCQPCQAAPAVRCAPPRFYGNADYLLWWTDGMGTPPLVTSSLGTPDREDAAVLGQPGTVVLFGGSKLKGDAQSGGRFTLGMWLDPCQSQGFEASYFTLGTQTQSFGGSSADYTILGRPFYNTVESQQDAKLIAYPGLFSGSLTATASTSFEGGELLFRQSFQRECWAECDLFIGYRWLQLEDSLLIEESARTLSGIAAGTDVDLFDRFDTSNSFHGAEVGMSLRRQIARCWSMELLAKIGLGNVNSVATVDGRTTTTAPTNGPVTSAGGLLARPSNIGRYERDRLASATELGLKLRRTFTDCIDLTFGYTFLYLSDVARAGDQIDLNIDDSDLPPASLALPEFVFQSSGFWAQGLSFGIEGTF